MGIVSFLDKVDDFILHNSFLDPLVALTNKNFKQTIKPYREAKRRGDLELMLSTKKKLIDYYDDELLGEKVKPEDLFFRFQAIASDRDIEFIISRYSEYMERILLHAERFELIVNFTLHQLPDNDILPMAKLLSTCTITQNTSKFDLRYLTNTKDRISSGLVQIAEKCPVHQKLEVYKNLSSNVFVTSCLKAGGCFQQVCFFKYLLSEKSDEEALRDLRFSRTWLSLEKTPNLYEHVQEYAPRFLPAMDYLG